MWCPCFPPSSPSSLLTVFEISFGRGQSTLRSATSREHHGNEAPWAAKLTGVKGTVRTHHPARAVAIGIAGAMGCRHTCSESSSHSAQDSAGLAMASLKGALSKASLNIHLTMPVTHGRSWQKGGCVAGMADLLQSWAHHERADLVVPASKKRSTAEPARRCDLEAGSLSFRTDVG